MSQVHVDTIYDKAGTGRPDFPAGLTASGPVSVGGTLTYQDVTNIDAVGLVTARTGVRITAGGLVVTAGVTTFSGADINIDGSAVGVTSVTWDASANSLIFKDESYAKFGDGSDLSIYHQNGSSLIANTTGQLLIRSSTGLQLGSIAGEVYVAGTENGAVDLYWDNSKKFNTDSAGSYTTGIHTASQSLHAGTTVQLDGGTGVVTATSYKGDGSALTGVGGEFDITSCLFI